MSYRYRAFGLRIASSFPLPELRPDEQGGDLDVQVGAASLPGGPGRYHFAVEGEVATLWVPDSQAAYRMIRGQQLLVDAGEQEIDRNVRLYLLGSALGAILHQRGLLPLHACALEFGGKAIAIMGSSGAGKSTLAAWLSDHGGRLLSDDVCVVRPAGEQRFSAAVGLPRLRLWRDVIEARGGEPDRYPQSFAGWDKFDVPAGSEQDADEVELVALFQLEAGGDRLCLAPVDGAEAVASIAANTYRGSYVRLMNRTAEHFEQCVRLARSLPLQRVTRPLEFRQMEEDYRSLLERIRQLTG